MTHKMIRNVITTGTLTSLLFTGLNIAHADTVTTTTTTTKTVVTTVTKTEKVDGGTIKVGKQSTKTKATKVKPATKTIEPYYNYNGYTARNADFELDPYFVQALNYGNFKLNDITVTKDKVIQSKAKKSIVKDTEVYKTNGVVTSMAFPVKQGIIKKADFLKAHASNTLLSDVTKKSGASNVTYKTKTSSYTASFDKKGFLTKIKINPAVTTY